MRDAPLSPASRLLAIPLVLVTVGSTGVGRATALMFASQGCRVFICGRDGQHFADAIETGSQHRGDRATGILATVGSVHLHVLVFGVGILFAMGLMHEPGVELTILAEALVAGVESIFIIDAIGQVAGH